MSVENKETIQDAQQPISQELAQPTLLLTHQVSQNTTEIIDENWFFQAISFLKNIFEGNKELTFLQEQKIISYFSQPSFLQHLNDYLSNELNEIYSYGNIDTFMKVSFVGFLLWRWKSPEAYAFSDIHHIDEKLVRNMFFAYESEITKYSRIGNIELQQSYINIYIKFLNFVWILAMLNEMDHDRRELIFLLTSQINKTIQILKSSSFIELDQKISSEKSSPTFWDTLDYIQARTWINSQHLEYVPPKQIEQTFQDFSKILDDMYKNFATASRVKFLSEAWKKHTLTSAFIANTTTFMFALIHRMEKENPTKLDELFNHPIFLDQIFQPYILQMNNAFLWSNKENQTLQPNVQNFYQFKKFCTRVVIKNYNMTFGDELSSFTRFEDVVKDVISVLDNLNGKDQVDFRLDFCYQIVSNTDYIAQDLLGNLAESLVWSQRSNSYHTEAVKLKLMDTIIKKISQCEIWWDFLEKFLEQVENYISKNKKNSIILNVYARLYLTLSFAYSKIPSQKEKALALYFMYEELNTSKILEEFYWIESDIILRNLFPGDNVENIQNHPDYIAEHERFVENKWHNTQKKINQISLSNRIDAYNEALEILSNEFFYGMVDIHVVNRDVDSIPKMRKWNSWVEFPLDLEYEWEIVFHTLIFHYPNNYKENFYKILSESGKVEHISAQIEDIFKKLWLYVLPIHKTIQNAILEALENGEKRCVPYFQPIVWVNGEVGSYECLMRILAQDGSPLLIKEVIWYEEDGSEIVKVYAIDEQLKVANHLWLTTRITQKLLSDVFDIAQKNPQFEFNINLSYDDIMNDIIFQKLKDLSSEFPWVVQNIVIELLENKIHHNSYFDRVKELSNLGYKIAVDDFGSEYNNISILSQLHRYWIKIHKLKIDQIVIKDILAPLTDTDLLGLERDISQDIIASKVAIENVKHFILLSQLYWISWWVVAEYVDNEFVLNHLKNLWVQWFQWYLIWKPNSSLEIKK